MRELIFDGFLKRRIPGKNGEGTPRTLPRISWAETTEIREEPTASHANARACAPCDKISARHVNPRHLGVGEEERKMRNRSWGP